MKKLESALYNEGEELMKLGIPTEEEMEACLRSALEVRRKRFPMGIVAAAVTFILLFTYSFDAIAYYGRKITGYDELTSGSIKSLNENGHGQQVNKTCTFSGGLEFTLDGLMFDDNELVIFYKLHSTGEKLDYSKVSTFFRIRGMKPFGYNQKSGQGIIVDDYTVKFTQTFDAPEFYEKWMKLEIEVLRDRKMETRDIGFTLDRNKAMKLVVKQKLNAAVKIDDYEIVFESLTASTMSTAVEGRIVAATEEAMNKFIIDDPVKAAEAPSLRFDIASDGGAVNAFSLESKGVSDNTIRFRSVSDALPSDISGLQIKNIRLETYKLLDAEKDIDLGTRDLQINGDLTLKRVYREGDETCAVIESRGIPVMGLFNGATQLEQAEAEKIDAEAASDVPVERIYRFKGAGDHLKLGIKLIRYSRYSSSGVEIPVE